MSNRVYYAFDPSVHVKPCPPLEQWTDVLVGRWQEDGVQVFCTVKVFQEPGLDYPTYWVTDEGVEVVEPASNRRVPREVKIEMVNRLLHDATDRRRLFVDETAPVAQVALRVQQRDESGMQRPHVTHPLTEALALALWDQEKP